MKIDKHIPGALDFSNKGVKHVLLYIWVTHS